MNFDSGSDDGTVEVFLATPTANPKSSETVSPDAPGKGRNLVRFFERVVAGGFDIAVTLDADVRSMEPGWVAAFAGPIARGEASYVTPAYRRHRFDGTTTNLFAFPFTYAWTGKAIRQPIGGDFGLSLPLVRHVLSRARTAPVGGYGIDIFMTLCAAAFDGRVVEAALDEKLHKPSFPHFQAIAREVIAGAAAAVGRQTHPAPTAEPLAETGSIRPGGAYRARDAAHDIFRHTRQHLLARRADLDRWLPRSSAAIYSAVESDRPAVRAAPWVAAVAEAFTGRARQELDPESLGDLLSPVLVARTVSFWDEVEHLDPPAVERAVLVGARELREAMVG